MAPQTPETRADSLPRGAGSKNDDMPVAGPTPHPRPLTLALVVEPPLSLLVDDGVDGGDGKSPP